MIREAELRDKVFWNNTIIGKQIEKNIKELTQEYWEAGFSTGRSIAITETNSKWLLAVQKLKEEVIDKQKQIYNYLRLMKEKGVIDRIDVREQIILKTIPISIIKKIDKIFGELTK